ncbi:hypothetical protein GALL_408590 [mine drainage metagenome]|uniref:Uncharacterized protein n=1 Tax=mine drainage metagenome TaxID=410659 RepID=A0A1J5Q153_9ZZZZ
MHTARQRLEFGVAHRVATAVGAPVQGECACVQQRVELGAVQRFVLLAGLGRAVDAATRDVQAGCLARVLREPAQHGVLARARRADQHDQTTVFARCRGGGRHGARLPCQRCRRSTNSLLPALRLAAFFSSASTLATSRCESKLPGLIAQAPTDSVGTGKNIASPRRFSDQ